MYSAANGSNSSMGCQQCDPFRNDYIHHCEYLKAINLLNARLIPQWDAQPIHFLRFVSIERKTKTIRRRRVTKRISSWSRCCRESRTVAVCRRRRTMTCVDRKERSRRVEHKTFRHERIQFTSGHEVIISQRDECWSCTIGNASSLKTASARASMQLLLLL